MKKSISSNLILCPTPKYTIQTKNEEYEKYFSHICFRSGIFVCVLAHDWTISVWMCVFEYRFLCVCDVSAGIFNGNGCGTNANGDGCINNIS